MRCSLDEFRALLGGADVAPELTAFLGADPVAGVPPEGDWTEVLRVLRHAAVLGFAAVEGAEPLRGLVAIGDGGGIRVRVRGDEVSTDVMRTDAPWPALVGCLPEREPAEGCEVTVPTAELAEARAEADARDRDTDWLAYELRRRSVPPDDARAVADLLTRADDFQARLSVAWRPDGVLLRRWPQGIEVHHAATGRAAVIPESPDDAFSLVTPADTYLLSKTLQEHLEHLASG
ncbi:ESX secretion-associated protein EspG [Saccharopolyspora griseoalba]|uniref:ESX secretion-associated protein EspG n=1 Tax=Saccharopolyspora griseoalba TaxID=1431848 RepID=A0ABW2LPC4_9PSEU